MATDLIGQIDLTIITEGVVTTMVLIALIVKVNIEIMTGVGIKNTEKIIDITTTIGHTGQTDTVIAQPEV